METLFLISDRDKEILNKNILAENIEIRTDREISKELLKKDYKAVIISSSYVDMYEEEIVMRIITLILTITNTPLYYLNVRETNSKDNIENFLKSKGIGNIYKIKWEMFDFKTLNKILNFNNILKESEFKENEMDDSRLLVLKQELENLIEEDAVQYLKQNKGLILDVVKGYRNLLKESIRIKNKNYKLSNENSVLKTNFNELKANILEYVDKYNYVKTNFNLLRRDVLSKKNNIEEYNKAIKGSSIAEYPKIEINNSDLIIIYFKEFEDIGFFNFYESLFYLLRNIYKVYTKSLIIERKGREFFDIYTDSDYIVSLEGTEKKEVIEKDKIVSYGNPSKLLKLLGSINSKIDIILIFDRTGTEETIVDSRNLMPFYIGSYKDKIKTLNFNEVSWISPFEGKWSNINPLMERKVLDKESKVVFDTLVSNHPFSKFLTNLLFGKTEE